MNTTILFRRRSSENSERDVLRHDVHLFEAFMNTMFLFSETELRAAQPNLHSGRLRLLLQVAAR